MPMTTIVARYDASDDRLAGCLGLMIHALVRLYAEDAFRIDARARARHTLHKMLIDVTRALSCLQSRKLIAHCQIRDLSASSRADEQMSERVGEEVRAHT